MPGPRPSTRIGPRIGPRSRLVLGLVILGVIVAFVVETVDPGQIAQVVERADPWLALLGALLAILGIACWSEAMRRLLPAEGERLSSGRGFLVYATGSMVRNVLPVGYASSIGVLSFVYRREASLSLHRSLAAVSVAELLGTVASVSVTAFGISLLGLEGVASPLLRWAALGVAVIGGVLLVGGTLVWYRRGLLERLARTGAQLVSQLLGRFTPGLGGRLTPAAVERSLGEYAVALSHVSARRRTVVGSLALAFGGWLAFVASLYASGLAVGYHLPIAVVLFVVPIAGYAAILPVPGGLGGYELGVAGVLHYLGGMDPAAALAVTLLFRLWSFWAVIAVGGAASAALSVDLRGVASAAMVGREPGPPDR